MATLSTVDGSATGYRPTRTLTFRTELRRQASRRRTQLALGFMVVLPLIILIAFEFGNDNGGGSRRSQFAALADLATAGGLNFALFTLLVSASFLLIVVVALFCGDTVASEASWGSLRYLLAVPVPRARLLGSKLLVSLFSCAVALVLPFSFGVDPFGAHSAFWVSVAFLAFLQLTASVLNLVPMPGVDGGNLVEPWLSAQWQRGYRLVAPYGMLLLIALLWTPVLNNLFFTFIFALGSRLGLPVEAVGDGLRLFQFWGRVF